MMGKKKSQKAGSLASKSPFDEKKKHVALLLTAVSKALFSVLAIGGVFDANDYTMVLDQFSEVHNYEIHDDDDIDAILDTMECHEQKRTGLVKILRSFADSIAAFRKNSREEDSMINADIYAENIERIEDAMERLSSNILSYQDFMANQRREITQLRISLQRAVKRATQFSMENQESNLADVYPILKYKMAFELLVRQYRNQIDWEEMVIQKIQDTLLQDGNIYRHLEPHGENRNTSIQVQNELNELAIGIQSFTKINKNMWIPVKENFLRDIMVVHTMKGRKNIEKLGSDLNRSKLHLSQSLTSVVQEDSRMSTIDKKIDQPAIFTTPSIQGVLNSFAGHDIFHPDICKCNSSGTSCTKLRQSGSAFYLLLGPSGSGKTFLCNMIEERMTMLNKLSTTDVPIRVIRPRLQTDFLGSSVGSFEDAILSLFSYIKTCQKFHKCILLLDGIEHILGGSFSDGTGDKLIDGLSNVNDQHMTCRVRSIFMAAMDKFRESYAKDEQPVELIVLCTARSHENGISNRFDKLFYIQDPDINERRLIIEGCLGLPNDCEQIGLGEQLARVISSTLGKSRGEIAQYCRKAIEAVPRCASIEECASRLKIMITSVQEIVPESIRGGLSNDANIDIRVSSAKELRASVMIDDNGREVFPLLGKNAFECWESIENTIIAPLCRWKTLEHLMHGNIDQSSPSHHAVSSQRKAVCSGLLLTGEPGTGKTALAHHCAAVAASINPAVKLVEVPCTSLVHKELGGSERSVRKLFETAKMAAPCILLLDGIENIAPVRGHDNTTEGTMDRLLSTLLTEMDGISTNTNRASPEEDGNSIAVIGITHNPSWIDPALLRPGRLEKCLLVEKPDNAARKEIFLNTIQDMSIDFSSAGFFDPKDKSQLAETMTLRTHNKSAAEIIAMCENAKMLALRELLETLDEHQGMQPNIRLSHRHFLPKMN